jgi:hypothetical protein
LEKIRKRLVKGKKETEKGKRKDTNPLPLPRKEKKCTGHPPSTILGKNPSILPKNIDE